MATYEPYPETAPPGYDDYRRERAMEPRNRASDAVEIQRRADEVVRKIKESAQMLDSNDWSFPLRAAPEAISVMALCFKAATHKCAKGIEISPTVFDSETGEKLGVMPYTTFHTNLQYCSDLGRLAFLEAEKRMGTLQGKARYMIEDEGTISYVIDLLDDPEDARDSLRPAMHDLATTAQECKEEAQAVQQKFQYWLEVIMHLKREAIHKKGMGTRNQLAPNVANGTVELNVTKKDENALGQYAARDKKLQRSQEVEAAQQALKVGRDNLKRAISEVEHAQSIYDATLQQRPPQGPELEAVMKMLPAGQDHTVGSVGLAQGFKRLFVGQDEKSRKKDHGIREEFRDKETKRKLDLWKEMQAEARSAAEARLNEARQNARNASNELAAARQQYSESSERLFNASVALGEIKVELEKLNNEGLELVDILKLLETSADRLGDLKGHITDLVAFFNGVCTLVSTVDKPLNQFLDTINRGIKEDTNDPALVEQVRLQRTSKKRLLANAYDLQGRFSAIADLSGLYCNVSKRYIRPGINKMEGLPFARGGDYDRKLAEFLEWCNASKDEIDQLTVSTGQEMNRNMVRSVASLQRKTITDGRA